MNCSQCGRAMDKRTIDQNAMFHAVVQDISKAIPWGGQMRDIHTWKRLLTAAWMRAKGERAELLPAVDGEGFDVLYRHTSKLSVGEMSDLIDYTMAWAADNVPAEKS